LLASVTQTLTQSQNRPDAAQADVARRFDVLLAALAKRPGLFRRPPAPRGISLWGAAGGGKMLLMDSFFRLAPEARKRRVHFHAFMTEVHERLAALRETESRTFDALTDQLASGARLLCLDELHIKDIADATIVSRVFEGLIERGTVLVFTSNAPPARLYYKGLKRELFLPFIALVEHRLDVIHLDAALDYRLNKLLAAPVWHVPADDAARRRLDAAFLDLSGAERGAPETLRVHGRDLVVRNAHDGVARFGFSDLCDSPLGAGDFGALARRYHTLIIDRIPRLDGQSNDIIRRFVILIDELYEWRVKLIASADAEPGALLTSGPQTWDFRRTSSRLAEMGSKDWLALPHGDLNGDGEKG
jgi:cell division protein ZapE